MTEQEPIEPFPIREDTPYFAAVGRLIVAYAEVESIVQTVAVVLSGLSSRKAEVLFGSMRPNEIIEKVRYFIRLRKKRDPKLFAEIDECLKQMKVISVSRNKLAHRTSEFSADAISVTNKHTAHFFNTVEIDDFTLDDLERMRRDCTCIYLRLALGCHNPDWLGRGPGPPIDKFYGPWHYRPRPSREGERLVGMPRLRRPKVKPV